MSTAAATVSARAAQPDSSRAWARVSATLNAVAFLVTLVLNLIEQGKNLAVTFRDHVRNLGDSPTRRFVGTGAIHGIGTRMRRGVMHVAPLHTPFRNRSNLLFNERLPAPRRDHTPPEQGTHARPVPTAYDFAPTKAARPNLWQPPRHLVSANGTGSR